MKKNTVINDLHIWKIAAAHQAAILKVTSNEPLKAKEYKHILKKIYYPTSRTYQLK